MATNTPTRRLHRDKDKSASFDSHQSLFPLWKILCSRKITHTASGERARWREGGRGENHLPKLLPSKAVMCTFDTFYHAVRAHCIRVRVASLVSIVRLEPKLNLRSVYNTVCCSCERSCVVTDAFKEVRIFVHSEYFNVRQSIWFSSNNMNLCVCSRYFATIVGSNLLGGLNFSSTNTRLMASYKLLIWLWIAPSALWPFETKASYGNM